MSATSRSITTAPDTRQVGAALLALVMLLAIGAVLAYGSLAAAKPQAPGAVTAPVVHDHGWSTEAAAGAAPILHDRGWSTDPGAGAATSERAAIDTGRHRPKSPVGVTGDSGPAGLVVMGARGGAIRYTGIPYPAAATAGGTAGNAGSTRIRLAR
jgi:hypothetical protein